MIDSDFNFLDIENEPESNLRGSRMDGYLYKVLNFGLFIFKNFCSMSNAQLLALQKRNIGLFFQKKRLYYIGIF